jgi:hypothetical protein
MKQKRLLYVVSLILVLAMTVVACAKKSMDTTMDTASYDGNATYGTADSAAVAPQEAPMVEKESKSVTMYSKSGDQNTTDTAGLSNSSSITLKDATALQSQDKIIRSFYLDVETQTFDSLITKLDSEIKRLKGYVETSQVSGKSIYDDKGARHASITARIPKNHVDEFVNTVGENANVTNKQESTENVSLQYADIESRKKALEIEQERLFALLEKTDTLENIVTLESRLSDIRYELQNYETTLRTYDNKVEYSTVTLSIQEVEKLTPAVEIKQSVGTRIQNGFSNTMFRLSEGCKNFVVWFVVNLPYLVIWAVIILLAVLIVKKVRKKIDKLEKNNTTQPPVPPMN